MKWTTIFTTIALGASLTVGAHAASASSTDASFIRRAQPVLLGQYALAAAAKNKTQNPALKAAATLVATDMGSASTFLKQYAASHNVSVTNKPTVRADMQYGSMQGLSGKAFDRRYAEDLNTDVQLELSAFQDEAKNGTDPVLKAFAKRQVAVLTRAGSAAQKIHT